MKFTVTHSDEKNHVTLVNPDGGWIVAALPAPLPQVGDTWELTPSEPARTLDQGPTHVLQEFGPTDGFPRGGWDVVPRR